MLGAILQNATEQSVLGSDMQPIANTLWPLVSHITWSHLSLDKMLRVQIEINFLYWQPESN